MHATLNRAPLKSRIRRPGSGMQTQPRGLETNRQIDTCIREESKHWPILVSGKNKSIFGLARTIARKNGLKAAEARVAQRLKLLAKKKKIVLPEPIRIK